MLFQPFKKIITTKFLKRFAINDELLGLFIQHVFLCSQIESTLYNNNKEGVSLKVSFKVSTFAINRRNQILEGSQGYPRISA